MSSQYQSAAGNQRSGSRTVQIAVFVGVLHALLAISVRAASGAPTELFDLYTVWAFAGGCIVGMSFVFLYLRWGLLLPAVVSLTLLGVGGWLTWSMYNSLDGAAPAFAWTPMTIYVTFWPIILGLVLSTGVVEWVARRLLNQG